jgi:hypothetical protein
MANLSTYVCVCVCVCMCVCMYVCMCLCVYGVFLYVYICVYMCVDGEFEHLESPLYELLTQDGGQRPLGCGAKHLDLVEPMCVYIYRIKGI